MAVDSPWFYFYYAVRLKDLLGRYRHQAWRTRQDQAPMVAQQTRLHQWLEQSEIN